MLEKYFKTFIPKDRHERWQSSIWWNSSLVNKIHQLMASQHFAIGDNGKLAQRNLQGYFDNPWIYLPFPEARGDMMCWLWKDVLFEVVTDKQYIPAYCRSICHKVVVVIPTVRGLFQWHDIMKNLCNEHDLFGKCGADRRDYTAAKYGAFFYCQGMEMGQRVKALVEEALTAARIADAHWKVLLKKGCTEMDAVCPSDTWGEPSETDLHFEDQFYDIFDIRPPAVEPYHLQREWLRNRIKFEWLDYARRIGDCTWKEVVPENAEYRDNLFGKKVNVVTY